jgi:hypothetical protein
MIDSEQHPYVEWIAREARRPVVVNPDARSRVMAAIRAEARPRRRSGWRRMFESRPFDMSPIGSALLAAGLVGIGVLAGAFVIDRDGRQAGQPPAVVASRLPVSDSVAKFVFIAPQAASVSVVGDFNGWDTTKNPLIRSGDSGLWTVKLPLAAGRHVYAFVVDGEWSRDPAAPVAPEDGFGHANSVRIVGHGAAL